MRQTTAILFGLSLLAVNLPLFGEDGKSQPAQTATTERVSLAAGGAIHINAPSSNLMVEAWDRPEVEITTTRSTRSVYQPSRQDQAKRCLESVKVVTEHPSGAELTVSTTVPSRGIFDRVIGAGCAVTVDQEIRAPRDSRLVIHHGAGYVLVSHMTGEMEVTSRSGDIMLMLPEPGPYAIDAKSKAGSVSSDFAGTARRTHLFTEAFTGANPPAAHRIYLRMGLGGITIKEVPSTPEAPLAP